MITALLAGFVLMGWRSGIDLAGNEYLTGLIGRDVFLSGVITEDPDSSEGKTNYRLGELRVDTQSITESGGADARAMVSTGEDDTRVVAVPGVVFVSGGEEKTLRRGDRVEISEKLNAGFGTFAGTFYRPKILKVLRPSGDTLLEIRTYMADRVTDSIPSPESALGLGYLLGIKSSLPEGLDETLKVVGLTHIIVASGSNLSILAGFARKLFGKVSRFGGLFLSLILVTVYVGMVGLSPSMMRAAIVSVLSLLAWYVGREPTPLRLLIIVAAATLVFNPMYVIDLGWLLSFGSFAGIMLVGPRINRFFYGKKEPGLVGATLLETVSASLVCLPILLYFFGTMSLISLLANLLVLPTISIAMALVFATGVAGMVFGSSGVLASVTWLGVMRWLPDALGWLSTQLLSFHLMVINFLGAQKNFVVEIPKEQWQVFLIYIPVVAICMFGWNRDRARRRRDPWNCDE